jgi:hypothetical protein
MVAILEIVVPRSIPKILDIQIMSNVKAQMPNEIQNLNVKNN